MATVSKGGVLADTNNPKNDLYALVDSATVTAIVNADISAGAAIADTKLATISTASKVSGAAITSLASIPAGAGVIPAANLTSVAQKGANSDITSMTGLTTALAAAYGGTGYLGLQMKAITYTGNAGDNRTLDHGLVAAPLFVFIQATGNNARSAVVWQTGDGTLSHTLADAGVASDCVKAVDATHVTIGTSVAVNNNLTPYTMICITMATAAL